MLPITTYAGKSRATPCNPKSNFSTERAKTPRSLSLRLPPHSPNSTSCSDQGFATTSLTNFQSTGAAKYHFAWLKQQPYTGPFLSQSLGTCVLGRGIIALLACKQSHIGREEQRYKGNLFICFVSIKCARQDGQLYVQK